MHSLCEDSFTPLHFASFFGNISLIKYLISQGANPYVTNACNINMLHVGAQGDQPISIAFVLTLGLDINSLDKRNSTPLHWAAFAGADLALQYLVAQGAEINLKDVKGLTPLHLAVKIA
jgi:ankyrin repeat protein